ncbi:hypothetical protein [Rhodopirellula sallentina]|uniref:DUF1257 domain-containing protein n=1 Tax=Rhodopirellula sallentina SM41 TaxID=1263870 RepID=M5UM14_9BACT|nr:hypothetical protein [Rhodopirellula sallentina]EMI57053.1 hypothetical protein RSSM_01463 [Rhodopirellula sallentina SM41]
MSHVVQIETQVRDATAVRAGCSRLGLDEPVEGEVRLFSETVSGLAVQLRDWRYPVVFDLDTGETKFDNYQGHWGKRERLDEFLQAYAVEKATQEARRKGYGVTERLREDGSIQLTIQVGQGQNGQGQIGGAS